MGKLRLTPQQLAFMETFGYLSFPGLLDDCIDEVIEAFEAVWAALGGGHDGKRHDGTARSCIVPFIGQSDYLSSLLDDPRVNGIFSSLLGDDFQYLGSDGNYLCRRHRQALGRRLAAADYLLQDGALPRPAEA